MTNHIPAVVCFGSDLAVQLGATYLVYRASRIAKAAAAIPLMTEDPHEDTFTITTDGIEMFLKTQAVPVWYIIVLVSSAGIDFAGNLRRSERNSSGW
jgi:hypothetical protein